MHAVYFIIALLAQAAYCRLTLGAEALQLAVISLLTIAAAGAAIYDHDAINHVQETKRDPRDS